MLADISDSRRNIYGNILKLETTIRTLTNTCFNSLVNHIKDSHLIENFNLAIRRNYFTFTSFKK